MPGTTTTTGSNGFNTNEYLREMSQYITFDGSASWNSSVISGGVRVEQGIAPQLYFKYVKSKFTMLERMRLDSRLKKVEQAFAKAVENGQEALAQKFLNEVIREEKESAIYAKGIRYFIENDDIRKHKRNIKGGHISDTLFKDFTRIIPKDVLAKKKKVEAVFDGFIIYHYWNEAAGNAAAKGQKMDETEKSRMRDPILFGLIKENNRLYFIADWEDELCDLTFDEIVDVVGKEESEITLTKNPKL